MTRIIIIIIIEVREDHNLRSILDDPRRVWNGDESGFVLCPKNRSVLVPRGTENVYEVMQGNEKESITVMFSFSAAAEVCPPMVVTKYQRIPNTILDSIPEKWGVGRSETGWMKSEVFYEYMYSQRV